jgi:DNA-binding transcriptional regulator YiaG
VRIFKTKWLARFARREGIAHKSLREAIERAERGMIDADLGCGLIKQRVARQGQGRSGGYRMIVAFRAKLRSVFLFGFAKNERENIEPDELLFLRKLGENWLAPMLQGFVRKLRLAIYRRSKMTKKLSNLSEAILEMADDQYGSGIMDKATHEKITIRLLGPQALRTAEPISGKEIRTLRERANLSQAAFARYLNLTAGYVSQLERGTKQPKGPALVLLNVIRHKGFEAIL